MNPRATLRPISKFTVVLDQPRRLTATLSPGIPIPGPVGPQGPMGPPGHDSTIPGPTGPKGDKGDPGNPGLAATVMVSPTITGAAGTQASVVNTGTIFAAILAFTIPQGAQGAQGLPGQTGPQGPQGPPGTASTVPGPPGTAATVTVSSTVTGAPGTQANVTNSGSSGAAILHFTIPQGLQGAAGATGSAGPPGQPGQPGAAGPPGPPGASAPATTTTLGSIIVGSGLSITPDGTLSATGGGGGSQTPWLSDIDGGGYILSDVTNVNYHSPAGNGDFLLTGFDGAEAWIGTWNNVTSSAFRLGIQANPLYIINSVGINNPYPQFALDVNGPIRTNDMIISTGGGSGTQPTVPGVYFTFDAPSSIGYMGAYNYANSVPLQYYIDSDPLYLNANVSNGPVVIGTRLGIAQWNPQYPLDVNGDCNLSAGSVYRIGGVPISTGGGGSQTPWTSDIDAAGYSLSNLPEISGSGPSNGLLIDASYFSIQIPGAGPALFVATGAGVVSINVALGIGTPTPPQYTLDVNGQCRVTGTIFAFPNDTPNPISGQAVYITYNDGIGYLGAYEYGLLAYQPLWIDADDLYLNARSGGDIIMGGATTYANLAAAQAALGVGTRKAWVGPGNALYVT